MGSHLKIGKRYRELVSIGTLRISVIFVICVGFSFGTSLKREIYKGLNLSAKVLKGFCSVQSQHVQTEDLLKICYRIIT